MTKVSNSDKCHHKKSELSERASFETSKFNYKKSYVKRGKDTLGRCVQQTAGNTGLHSLKTAESTQISESSVLR